MPSYTSKGFPYILGTESADTIDDWALELANKLNGTVPFAIASGQYTLNFTASNTATTTVTFPVGRFSVAPNVFAMINSGGTGSAKVIIRAAATTASQTDIRGNTGDGTNITAGASGAWIAIQMLSNAADG